jgi:hypothetical protein
VQDAMELSVSQIPWKFGTLQSRMENLETGITSCQHTLPYIIDGTAPS